MIELSKIFIGNTDLIERLINAFENKTLSNSIIFSGQKGIGKTTAAFFLINKILMNNELTNNNSNFLYNNTHPNIRFLIN